MINVIVFMIGCIFGMSIFMLGREVTRREYLNEFQIGTKFVDQMIEKFKEINEDL